MFRQKELAKMPLYVFLTGVLSLRFFLNYCVHFCYILLLLSFCMLLQSRVPFAVMGSNSVMEVGGRKVRARKYPWGIAEGKVTVNEVLL